MFSIIWILIPITIYIQHSAQMIMRMISKWKRNHQKNDGTLLTKIYCRLNPYFILFTNSFILFIISFVFVDVFSAKKNDFVSDDQRNRRESGAKQRGLKFISQQQQQQ